MPHNKISNSLIRQPFANTLFFFPFCRNLQQKIVPVMIISQVSHEWAKLFIDDGSENELGLIPERMKWGFQTFKPFLNNPSKKHIFPNLSQNLKFNAAIALLANTGSTEKNCVEMGHQISCLIPQQFYYLECALSKSLIKVPDFLMIPLIYSTLLHKTLIRIKSLQVFCCAIKNLCNRCLSLPFKNLEVPFCITSRLDLCFFVLFLAGAILGFRK